MRLAYPIGPSGTERSAFMRGWQARGLATIREAEAAQPVPPEGDLWLTGYRDAWKRLHEPDAIHGQCTQPVPLAATLCEETHHYGQWTGKANESCPVWDQHLALATAVLARLAAEPKP